MFNTKTVIRLSEGIQSIVSENRSSLSIEDLNLLKDCITYLETVQNDENPKSSSSCLIVTSVIEILFRILFSDDFDNLKDLFR